MSYCGSSCGYGSSGASSYGQSAASYGGSYSGAQQSYFPKEQMYAHSSIDSIVSHESVGKPAMALPQYVPSSAKGAYLSLHTPGNYFVADTFLKAGSTARFVGDAAEIQEYIQDAFRATTGEELPKDIIVQVLNDREFRKAHASTSGSWSEGIQGFSLNSNGRGASQVFARADQLDKLMLTIGHEIGHVLTKTLKNAHDEEAKAFAFSLAWMETIRERNIAGIGKNILPEPANNGLHDIAFDFVQRIIMAGTSAFETFVQLAKGMLTITEQPILVEA
jgi:hypothetical protein